MLDFYFSNNCLFCVKKIFMAEKVVLTLSFAIIVKNKLTSSRHIQEICQSRQIENKYLLKTKKKSSNYV
jgi:hypothetical protein